jgi:RHS repeat-associated protein
LIDPNIVFDSYTTYPSAFLVIDPNGIYSKHYYAGTQRIVSRLGDDNADIFNTGANRTTTEKDDSKKLDETVLRNVQVTDLKAYLKDAKIGEVSFKEYKGSTYQEEETLLAEDLKENRAEGDLVQERAPVSAPVYFYHPDHLGSSTFLTDANGNAYQFFINLPFGETMAQQLPDTYYRTPFKFNGKELDEETGLYYYGARYYDPKISIWLSVDPLAEAFPNWNPYNYTMQNPINLVDPTGMSSEEPDHIIVTKGKTDGTYVVKSGEANSDRGVYLDDGKGGKGERVGTMKTTHSFFDETNKAVAGTSINTKSKEGQTFIDNEIIGDNPNLFFYKDRASLNEHYDFKSRGLAENASVAEALIYRTRGSMTADGEMASARDFGNIAAGIVASRAGLPHWIARWKFEQLQGGTEPPVSAKAQQQGLDIGSKLFKKEQAEREVEKIKNGYIGPLKY